MLGTRWVYDGAHDPVLVAQLIGLIRGEVAAQDQYESDTADPAVTATWSGADAATSPIRRVSDGNGETTVSVGGASGQEPANTLRIVRELQAQTVHAPPGTHAAAGSVTAEWDGPAGARLRGPVALLS